MDMNKKSVRIYASIAPIMFLVANSAIAAESEEELLENKNLSVEVGAEYEYSDNIYKSSADETSGNTRSADIDLGYKKKLRNTNIALAYSGEYSDTSEDSLEDSNYWVGNSSISQQIFNKNTLVSLAHSRQRYLIDQNEVDLEENNDEKDILTGSVKWVIPYSPRSSFSLGAAHSQTWYQANDIYDYNTNSGNASWQYALNKKTQFLLSYSVSNKIFDNVDYDTTEYDLNARVTRQYNLGSYSLSIGENWVDIMNDRYKSNSYGFTIDALANKHLFTFNASYLLTNTADQIGTDNSLDYSDYQLYKQTDISLQYNYSGFDERLTNALRLYFITDDAVTTFNEIDNEDQDKYGAYGYVSWQSTSKITYDLSFNYYKTNLSSSYDKTFTESEVGVTYNITPSLYLRLAAGIEKQQADQNIANYQEQLFTTRIAYKY